LGAANPIGLKAVYFGLGRPLAPPRLPPAFPGLRAVLCPAGAPAPRAGSNARILRALEQRGLLRRVGGGGAGHPLEVAVAAEGMENG